MLLLGNYQHALDDKNRIRLPAKYREMLGDNYILLPGMDGCIFVFSADDEQKFIKAIADQESLDPDKAELLRALTEHAAVVEADKQGRFMLTQDLLELAQINKNIRIVGALSKVEIWSEERYIERRNKTDLTPKGLNAIYKKLHEAMETK